MELGTGETSLALMKGALAHLSPYAVLYSGTGEMGLGQPDLAAEVPVEVETGTHTDSVDSETRRYQPAEQLEHPEETDRTAKEGHAVYTLGAMLYEMVTGYVPYAGYMGEDVGNMVVRGAQMDFEAMHHVDGVVAGLVEACLRFNGSERPSLKKICDTLAPHLGDTPLGAAPHTTHQSEALSS